VCRWIAYLGDPINVGAVLYEPANSIIRQSLVSRLGVEATNGDGFGLGWYPQAVRAPLQYRTTAPAWGDPNLAEITRHLQSPCFLAHVRATTGTAVQQTNCHPFRHGRWLFAHNGSIDGWPLVRRELMLAIDPALFPLVQGSTDSEVMFLLALGFGLDEDPIGAIERMAGLVERACAAAGARQGLQMTVCATDGSSLYAARHATRGIPRSLFLTADAKTVKTMYPGNAKLGIYPDNARMVVSEPLADLLGAHHELPPGCAVRVTRGAIEQRAFTPR